MALSSNYKIHCSRKWSPPVDDPLLPACFMVRRPAHRLFGGETPKKVWYSTIWHACSGACQRSELKTVGVISGRCNIASSPVGLNWIDLRLRARSLPLGADACRYQGCARMPHVGSELDGSLSPSLSSFEDCWASAVRNGAGLKICT